MGNTYAEEKVQIEQLRIIEEKLKNIPDTLQYSQEELETLKQLTAIEIQQKILTGKYTLEEVFKMYHQIKQQNNNENNALTEVLYSKPLKRCQELQKTDLKQYPLLGFIFSIKDSNKLKGTVCTNGFKINIGKIEDQQPESIKHLIEKGAIITCKGNIPQALFSMESFNHVFGATKNPYDPERISGGSSGGEACLIKLGLVNCAIGSDVAGSLRIPALCCGISAFKPTIPRVSNDQLCTYFYKHDWAKSLPERMGVIKATIGPMAKTVKELEVMMKVLCQGYEYDREVPPIPWSPKPLPKRVGYLKPFDLAPISIGNNRAFEMAKNALKNSGVELVELNIDDLMEEVVITAVAAFQKNNLLKYIFQDKAPIKEPLFNAFTNFQKAYKVPQFLLKKVAKDKKGTREGVFLKGMLLSFKENSNFIEKWIDDLYVKFHQKMKDLQIQDLIAPGMCTPPVKHLQTKDTQLQAVYCFLFNLFNMPCGAIPITRVQEKEDVYEDHHNDKFTVGFQENIKGSVGLPLGVLVASLPWRDEECMEIMKEIESKIKFDHKI